MPIVDMIRIPHSGGCEQGFMFKTALTDEDNQPVAFALIFSYHRNTIYFRGYCSHCGQVFEASWILESLLRYPRVD